jgi:thioester reductase-like protein
VTSILLTGASGSIGADLTVQLAGLGHEVICLLHRQREVVRNNGLSVQPGAVGRGGGSIQIATGDITAPNFGLNEIDYADLLGRVELVVHSAAVTEFGLPDEAYERINVGGTREVLSFCTASGGRDKGLIHVSTAYVCGERRGHIHESELLDTHGFANAYEKSKFDAEILVELEQAKGLPAAIVRPSIVVGNSRTGRIRDFKNIYAVMKLSAAGSIRSIPGNYDATLDLVPVDYCVAVLAGLVESFRDAVGTRFHVVRGNAVTLRDFSDVFAEYPSFEVPRFIPPQSFSVQDLSKSEARYFEKGVALYESYFKRSLTFQDPNTRSLLNGALPRMPAPKSQLRTLLNYAIDVGYLGRPKRHKMAGLQ